MIKKQQSTSAATFLLTSCVPIILQTNSENSVERLKVWSSAFRLWFVYHVCSWWLKHPHHFSSDAASCTSYYLKAWYTKFNTIISCNISDIQLDFSSRVRHEYLYTLCTCVSFSWVQTISSSTVKTLKYCVMLSSAVFLTSCTSWLSLQNRVWTGSLCQRAMSPALSFCHQFTASLLQGPLKLAWSPLTQQTRLIWTLNPKLHRGW